MNLLRMISELEQDIDLQEYVGKTIDSNTAFIIVYNHMSKLIIFEYIIYTLAAVSAIFYLLGDDQVFPLLFASLSTTIFLMVYDMIRIFKWLTWFKQNGVIIDIDE